MILTRFDPDKPEQREQMGADFVPRSWAWKLATSSWLRGTWLGPDGDGSGEEAVGSHRCIRTGGGVC